MHKHCEKGRRNEPVEALRLAPLLSRGARVFSERAHLMDEDEWRGL